MKLYTILFLHFSTVGFILNAQDINGILVNTQLDSIRAEFIFPLTNTSNNEYVLMDTGSAKIKIRATQILSLVVDETEYIPIKVNDNYYIARCVSCVGFLSRLRYKPVNDSQYSVELLKKMDGSSIEVPTFGFKSIISDYLKDCPETINQINELKYRRKKLDSLIISYNNCKVSELKIFDEPDKYSDMVTLIEGSKDITDQNQKEIVDILNSMKRREINGETIPNYLISSLKELTAGKTVEKGIETLLKSLQN